MSKPSALKRTRQNAKARARNRSRMADLKTAIKKVRTAKSKADALKVLKNAVSLIDKAGRKGLVHARNASRKISRLTKFVNTKK